MSPFTIRTKKTDGPSHFIIIVSKKIDKRAVKRNRIRRIIRESLRHLVPIGMEITCVVHQNIAEYKQQDVEKILHEIIRT